MSLYYATSSSSHARRVVVHIRRSRRGHGQERSLHYHHHHHSSSVGGFCSSVPRECPSITMSHRILRSLSTTTTTTTQKKRVLLQVLPAMASTETTNNNNTGRAWEVVLASIFAFCASASLVTAFPSHSTTTTMDAAEQAPFSEVSAFPRFSGGVKRSVMYSGNSSSAVEEQKAAAIDERARVPKPYDISVRAIKGGRVTMEDEYFVASGGRFVAVFDGHGGGGVSQWLKRNVFHMFQTELQQKHWEERDDYDSTGKDKIPSVSSQAAALRSAFERAEQDVMAQDTLQYQGSTAVAVVVHESEDGHRTLLSANVGDSRAILSRRREAVDLTRDHKPNEEREKARILAMGETIEWDRFSKVHRVRNLSLSRAIGDRYAKPAVSGEVEIKHYPVVEGGDEFILLASDGVWDVMTSQEVVSFVHNRLENEKALEHMSKEDIENYKHVLRKHMAKFVAREAIRRGSGDNVSVVMVWLNDLPRGGAPSS